LILTNHAFALQDGIINMEEWIIWIKAEHTAKRAALKGSGDKWIKTFLETLARGCDAEELKRYTESPEEAAARTGPTVPMLNAARELHARMSALSSSKGVTRPDLSKANRGDFKTFNNLDNNADGLISMAEWMDYIERAHAHMRSQQKGKGDKVRLPSSFLSATCDPLSHALTPPLRYVSLDSPSLCLSPMQWLKNLLGNLDKGCCLAEAECFKETEEEAAARVGPTSPDLEHANMIYDRIAALNESEGASQADLIKANRGNFRLFEKMNLDENDSVSREEFLNFLIETHRVKRAKKKGTGDKACMHIPPFPRPPTMPISRSILPTDRCCDALCAVVAQISPQDPRSWLRRGRDEALQGDPRGGCLTNRTQRAAVRASEEPV